MKTGGRVREFTSLILPPKDGPLLPIVLITLLAVGAFATDTVTYYPVSDGGVFSTSGVNVGGYLIANGSYKGDMHFEAFTPPVNSTIALSLGIYALPMHGKNVQIFGFNTADAVISAADYNRGSRLGTLVLPDTYDDFGKTITFDVTSFVRSAPGPYWGFLLVSDGLDNFNSLSYYVGEPEALKVTVVPEPSGVYLVLLALCAVGLWQFKRF